MITLPPGKYYIGDPCYVFSGDDWDEILDVTNCFRNSDQKFKDRPVFADSTAYGDGGYRGSNGFTYGVDAGLIGAIPVELISKQPGDMDGTIIDAPQGLSCHSVDGSFSFVAIGGVSIAIDTGGSDEDSGWGDSTLDDDN